MLDPSRTRDLTLARLADLGCLTPTNVPPLEDGLAARPVEEVITRLFSLHGTAAVSFGFDRKGALDWLEAEGLGAGLAEFDRAYLEGRAGDGYQFQGRIEAMWALAWAMGLVEEMPTDEPCADDFVLKMPDLRQHESTADLRRAAQLRGLEELTDYLDLYRCLHHLAMAAELGGPELPPGLGTHTIAQRHQALAWLLGQEVWERVPFTSIGFPR